MSAYIKRQIGSMEDNIYSPKRDLMSCTTKFMSAIGQEKLFEYELTLDELDNQYV